MTVSGNVDNIHRRDLYRLQQLGRAEEMAFTAQRSYASAVLGVVILSVYPSVTRGLSDYLKNLPAIFLYHRKRQSF